jgi:hypothetical protein
LLGALGNFGDMFKACFAASTPILTPDSSKPIEQFRPGDWILSAPEDDPEAPPQPRLVEEVFENYAPLMDLLVGGQTIRTTAEHPFWVRGRGWTTAHQLMAGDHLKSHDGRWVVLDSVVGNLEAAPAYNLRVAEYHTYFVGRSQWGFSVWAHNANWYHGTDAQSADDIVKNGLSVDQAGKVGNPMDEKGFSVTSNPATAQGWANFAEARRGRSGAAVIVADEADLPPLRGSESGWCDPGEAYIPTKDMHSVGPGAFKPYNPGGNTGGHSGS